MFDINRFKSKIDRYGGAANPSLFKVSILEKRPNTTEFLSDATFFCHTTNITGINIVTHAHRPDGMGVAAAMPVGIEGERLDLMFLVDDSHAVLKFFHKWMRSIYNYSSSIGNRSAMADDPTHGLYEIGYRSDYAKVIVVQHFSINGESYEWIFDDAYPVDIGNMRASWSDNSGHMELPVHFAYSRFTMTPLFEADTILERVNGSSVIITKETVNRAARTLPSERPSEKE